MRKTIVRLALATAVIGAVAIPSYAFRMIQNTSVGRVSAGAAVACNASGGFTHWAQSAISWRLNTSGQGSNKAAALTSAIGTWDSAKGDQQISYGGTTSAGFSTDGQNTVLFARGNGCTGNCLAITALVLSSGQVITETDISFNSRWAWNINGSDIDFQAVATHELGHTLGIHHTEVTGTPRPTMYATYFGTDGRTLENDDRSAATCSDQRY
jgi:hypothetical protein